MICKNNIEINVNWKNLFCVPKYLICNKCSKKYIPSMELSEYEFNKIKITCFSLFGKRHMINPNAFMLELSKLFSYVANRYDIYSVEQQEYFMLLCFDNLEVIKNIELLNVLIKLTNYEIVIISTYK